MRTRTPEDVHVAAEALRGVERNLLRGLPGSVLAVSFHIGAIVTAVPQVLTRSDRPLPLLIGLVMVTSASMVNIRGVWQTVTTSVRLSWRNEAVSDAGARVTISAGLAASWPGASRAELLWRADQALYGAKHAGRNRTEAWSSEHQHAWG